MTATAADRRGRRVDVLPSPAATVVGALVIRRVVDRRPLGAAAGCGRGHGPCSGVPVDVAAGAGDRAGLVRTPACPRRSCARCGRRGARRGRGRRSSCCWPATATTGRCCSRRLADTFVGIAVGLIVNLVVWPPLRDRGARAGSTRSTTASACCSATSPPSYGRTPAAGHRLAGWSARASSITRSTRHGPTSSTPARAVGWTCGAMPLGAWRTPAGSARSSSGPSRRSPTRAAWRGRSAARAARPPGSRGSVTRGRGLDRDRDRGPARSRLAEHVRDGARRRRQPPARRRRRPSDPARAGRARA